MDSNSLYSPADDRLVFESQDDDHRETERLRTEENERRQFFRDTLKGLGKDLRSVAQSLSLSEDFYIRHYERIKRCVPFQVDRPDVSVHRSFITFWVAVPTVQSPSAEGPARFKLLGRARAYVPIRVTASLYSDIRPKVGSLAWHITPEAGGSTSWGRDSHGKRLGVKLPEGAWAQAGSIIIRQRGTKYSPGKNVKRGNDDTLYAHARGFVHFKNRMLRHFDGSLKKKTIVQILDVKQKGGGVSLKTA
jgi:large subunit ribosomal protein L27